MRNAKRNFVSMTALVAGVLLAVACGGGSQAPKTPSGDQANAAPTSASSSGAGSAATSGGTTPGAGNETSTTTTTALPDGGELQGAKLGSSTRKEIEIQGDAGPRRPAGGSANEPGRSAKDLQTIVGARRDDARACYDKALPQHPGMEGDLDIKWKIDPDGNVTDIEVDTTKSQILEPTVAQCIMDIIKKIKFAKSEKGFETRAHYPFNFHPKGAQRAGAKGGSK